MKKTITILALLLAFATSVYCQDTAVYLKGIKAQLNTINLVFTGVLPLGYFKTPEVRTFESYPFLILKPLEGEYPIAVINVIITSIGGENSIRAEKIFKRDVLSHRPDVLFIDYALNDKTVGKAWDKMIRKALKRNIKIILLTSSPSLNIDVSKADNILSQHRGRIIALAKEYSNGLADSYAAFGKIPSRFGEIQESFNDPNKRHMNRSLRKL